MSLGSAKVNLSIDQVTAAVSVVVVPDEMQDVPVLVGQSFTELSNTISVKNDKLLCFASNLWDVLPKFVKLPVRRVILRVVTPVLIPVNHLGLIRVQADDYNGDLLIEATLRQQEQREFCIPRTIITLTTTRHAIIPLVNLSEGDLVLTSGTAVVGAWPCEGTMEVSENILRVQDAPSTPLPRADIIIGPVDETYKLRLINILDQYRDCFAQSTAELGCAKSAHMNIRLNDEKPFVYRPYRMARSEQEAVKEIIDELLRSDIIRESDSDFCSPILLVKKKNGEQRMCIDFRKLNSQTVRENHPLPRIDDQVDRLQGGVYFISLDLRAGYYQVPLSERSKRFTSFVTPRG